ncbi:MAG: MFS transporter [Gemmatimonadaceae bacterium]|nr:MFS transporter [Gemmatimonadaceae bacterium]
MRTRAAIALAMFFTLVPVTLLVPGLHELVMTAHGGSASDAHAFMTVNMLAGMFTVPLGMRLARRRAEVGRWIALALVVDALAFVGMWLAPSLPVLFAFRVLDGAVHLPAVTLLMLASNRTSGEKRGGSLGALATALMIGVAIGSPFGGWLVDRGTGLVYTVGAALLVVAAVVSLAIPAVPVPAASPRTHRYAFDRERLRAWIPLGYAFMDRFSIGVFVSTFTLFLTQVHGLSASQRGGLIALFMLPFALLCYPAGRLADRIGWFVPMMVGNVLFGVVFASYGVVPQGWLPAAMLASGVLSALMFTPNLLLISDLARRGHGEGLFGAFQVAGSLGFLVGPMVGGILLVLTRGDDPVRGYRTIFALVGALEGGLALLAFGALRALAREVGEDRAAHHIAERVTSPRCSSTASPN